MTVKQHSNGKWYTKFTIRGVTKHLLCAGATTQKEALEIENGFIYKLQQQMNGVIPKDQKNVYLSAKEKHREAQNEDVMLIFCQVFSGILIMPCSQI